MMLYNKGMDGYNHQNIVHYYGDTVRKLLIGAAIVMLVGLPIFNDRLPVSAPISIVAILILGLFAGLTNPRKIWVSVVNAIFSVIGIFIFEYYAVQTYDLADLLFWANQALAIIFFIALYYSTKSWRARTIDS